VYSTKSIQVDLETQSKKASKHDELWGLLCGKITTVCCETSLLAHSPIYETHFCKIGLVIKYVGEAVLRPLANCTRCNCPLAPHLSYATVSIGLGLKMEDGGMLVVTPIIVGASCDIIHR